MQETISDLMCHYHYNPNAADYCCEFCGETAKSNVDHNINHRSDCDGVRFMKALSGE